MAKPFVHFVNSIVSLVVKSFVFFVVKSLVPPVVKSSLKKYHP